MTKKNTAVNQNFVNNIKAVIANSDREKTLKYLDLFSEMNTATLHRCLFEISTAGDDDAFFMLNYLIQTKSLPPDLRDNILELILDKASLNSLFAILFIENTDVEKQRQAIPLFANILVTETETDILLKVIRVIGNTKEKSCIDLIADFIFYDNEELKAAAVDALERIGGSSVLKRLSFAATTSKADRQIAEAIDRLKKREISESRIKEEEDASSQFASRSDTLHCLEDDSDITRLLTMLNSLSPYERHTAGKLLVKTGVKAIPAVTENINMNDSDSIINGLDVIGNIKNESALPAVLKILNSKPDEPGVRFAAYEAVSKLTQTDSSSSLIKGIEDSSEPVRIAAASAINQNLSKILAAGLKGKIETSGKNSKQRSIVAAIIDSHADKIFSSLLDSDSFVFLASEYLARANDLTLNFFIELLNKRGTKTLARNIQESRFTLKSDKGLSVFVVDDSEIMLKYYIKYFHTLGHSPRVFENPEKALESLKQIKPDILITDLNMLHMNGLQLTTRIRRHYNSKELPVVIITTQSNFVGSAISAGLSIPAGETADDALTNLVLKKPPEPTDLKPLLDNIAQNG